MVKNTIFFSFLFLSLLIFLIGCSESEQKTSIPEQQIETENERDHLSVETQTNDWSYEGETGPKHWGELDSANLACKQGKEQSPINVKNEELSKNNSKTLLEIKYSPAMFTLVNNGHTIQANSIKDQNSIILDKIEYKLEQFHFHTPSEHQFDGGNFDMELHLVHKNKNGRLAVLGVIIKAGDSNNELETIWSNAPKNKSGEVTLEETIDLMKVLPKDKQLFRYNGSLTTPPCTEGVTWIVLQEPIQMSNQQIETFRNIFQENHRPVQPTNERKILSN
ncbi:carbonic anhydrase [Cytobacillus oceanisediminis]|uniref:carbonic anhydrase n=1 Tax=Cytobacillus oceanisediminis TaxID=665099 RepID=A0A2V3ABC3_9BACI|nr:carbonic anhydrase family protein [Cytobacillus oceanisediminis]PWW32554.1 carbonic anhydrase [Cytobacillus oceanisediminis]